MLEGVMPCYTIKSSAPSFTSDRYGDVPCTRSRDRRTLQGQAPRQEHFRPASISTSFSISGAYICSEETGLINRSRQRCRIKPPFPAVEARSASRPSNNVETLACVTQIMKKGNDCSSPGVRPTRRTRRRQLRPETLHSAGHVEEADCRVADGRHHSRTGRAARRRVWKAARRREPGGCRWVSSIATRAEGRRARLNTTFARLNGPAACSASGSAPPQSLSSTTRQHGGRAPQRLPVLQPRVAGNARRAAKPAGCSRSSTHDAAKGGKGPDILIDVADRIGIMPGTTSAACGRRQLW